MEEKMHPHTCITCAVSFVAWDKTAAAVSFFAEYQPLNFQNQRVVA